MSQLLKINNSIVDIDEKTAIGITLQSYNIQDVAKKHINVSNSFSIPKTDKNLTIFGLANDSQSTSSNIYNFNYCDYWIDNEQLIVNSKIRVQSIGDRIELFIFEKADFWDETKLTFWPEFISEMLDWLSSEKGLPVQASPYIGGFSEFVTPYINATSGVILPLYFGTMVDYKPAGETGVVSNLFELSGNAPAGFTDVNIVSDFFNETISVFETSVPVEAYTEYFVSKINLISSITQYYTASSFDNKIFLTANSKFTDLTLNLGIQGTYIKDSATSTVEATGITGSSFFLEQTFDPPLSNGIEGSIYLKFKNASGNKTSQGGHFCIFAKTLFEFIEYKYDINFLTSGGVLVGNIWDDIIANSLYIPIRNIGIVSTLNTHYFEVDNSATYEPLDNQIDKETKTVYDFINSFMQTMNVVKDEFPLLDKHTIRLARFDDIKTKAPVVDFSEKTTGEPVFKPFIDGYAQENRILFSDIYPEGSEIVNSKILTCGNKNIDASTDLLTIDSYIPSVFNVNSQSFLSMKDKESFKTFSFFLSNGNTDNLIAIYYVDQSSALNLAMADNMQVASIYDLNSEYNFLEEIIAEPKVYNIDKWLTITDIRNLTFFTQYYIRSLNGSFFINKINGFNPNSNSPTNIELIKTSNKTPITPPDLDYYMDGVLDPYTDGEGNYYIAGGN